MGIAVKNGIFLRRQKRHRNQRLDKLLGNFPAPRYRQPIEPEMAILGVFLLTEAGRKANARGARRQ